MSLKLISQATQSAYADERAAFAAVTADGYKIGPTPTDSRRPRRGGVGGRTNYVQSLPQTGLRRTASSSFRRFGGIGILILDVVPPLSTISPTIADSAHWPLRTSHWAMLDRALRNVNLVALIICCDRPLIPEPNGWGNWKRCTSSETPRCSTGHPGIRALNDLNPEAIRLLDSLFDWLAFPLGGSQRRNVQLFCGRHRSAWVLR